MNCENSLWADSANEFDGCGCESSECGCSKGHGDQCGCNQGNDCGCGKGGSACKGIRLVKKGAADVSLGLVEIDKAKKAVCDAICEVEDAMKALEEFNFDDVIDILSHMPL